jgi:hypothetical protein
MLLSRKRDDPESTYCAALYVVEATDGSSMKFYIAKMAKMASDYSCRKDDLIAQLNKKV